MINLSEELQTAIDAAKKGATVALSYFQTDDTKLESTYKKDRSIVTKADWETENIIKKHIRSSFQDVEFITEEGENETHDFKNVWIIDPIDGSREFSRGMNLWGINIAHAVNGEIIQGVCYLPALDILIHAEKNKGAYLNDIKTRVSRTKALSSAFLGISSIKRFKGDERKTILELIEKSGSTRTFATAYSGYCVTSERMDAYIAGSHNRIWDIAPFVPIINESGGRVTDWKGKELEISSDFGSVIASNGHIHDQVLEIVNKNK